jgi:ATP-dependent Zn protease
MSPREDYQLKHLLHAYHEAGHAVVWHVVGGLVEEVSIASSRAGYKGYCRFGFLLPQGEDEYLEGSERDDLEKIYSLLLRLSSEAQQRSAIQDACWKEAQQILSDYWPAVQALAAKLLKQQTLDGRDTHSIIWRTTGYPDADGRFGALNLP